MSATPASRVVGADGHAQAPRRDHRPADLLAGALGHQARRRHERVEHRIAPLARRAPVDRAAPPGGRSRAPRAARGPRRPGPAVPAVPRQAVAAPSGSKPIRSYSGRPMSVANSSTVCTPRSRRRAHAASVSAWPTPWRRASGSTPSAPTQPVAPNAAQHTAPTSRAAALGDQHVAVRAGARERDQRGDGRPEPRAREQVAQPGGPRRHALRGRRWRPTGRRRGRLGSSRLRRRGRAGRRACARRRRRLGPASTSTS